MNDESRTFIWLEELLEDPEMLEMPKPVAARCVWPNRITLLAAREKAGKSTLAGAIAAAVSSGTPFLNEEVMHGNVLIVALEEHPQDFATRLVKFGCDPSKVAIVTGGGPGIVKDVREACESVKPTLIVWDTLGAFANAVSGSQLDPGDSAAWTRIMMEIVLISREYGASLLLHHSRKSDGAYRDSTAIGANVDVILEMHGSKDEPRTLKPQARGGLVNEEFVLTLNAEQTEFSLRESVKEVRREILKFVGANPGCGLRELRDAINADNRTVDKVRKDLLQENEIVNTGTHQKHKYTRVAK